MTLIESPHDRRNMSAESTEVLLRDAGILLEATGVYRSRAWISRTVRAYEQSAIEGFPFGLFLVARLGLNENERRALAERSDLRYLLSYADPTGEQAARNVDRERRR